MEQFDFTDSPLFQDTEGRIRVIGSRVTLDVLVWGIKNGDTPEEIQDCFPSLSLVQINGVIAWYRNHTAEADEFLEKEEAEAEEIRKRIESQPGYKERHEELKRRWEQLVKN